MKTEELLKKHPKVTKLIKKWMSDLMYQSFKDSKIPTELKEFMKTEEIEEENIIPIIDANPRNLWEIFDENNIYIIIDGGAPIWFWKIDGLTGENFGTRKEAERDAVEKAFEILEAKL